LPFILQVCDPRDVKGNQICMAFKYKFHKERLADVKIREVMEKVLFEVFEKPLTIEAVIDEMMESKQSTATPDNISLDPEENPHEEAQKVEEAPEIKEEESSQDENNNLDSVTEKQIEKPEEGKGMIDDLLKTFGGKVVG
jgi:hypothetical protein